MTRKDYIRIARALNQTYASACESKQSADVLEAILRTSYSVASELAADNTRFNGEHFMSVVRGVRPLESRPSKKQAPRLSCDQCQMLSINRVACHETGCPNSRKTWVADRQEWVLFVECRECGCEVEQGMACNCQESETV